MYLVAIGNIPIAIFIRQKEFTCGNHHVLQRKAEINKGLSWGLEQHMIASSPITK
ncbi:hypothetical protein HDF26_003303 [Pedobacter cryoconitis]|uniref:Uncharacterized protein n=1 Tax=Pedobacter cryoconitis TaxID=188932 RepID=A0A7W8ZLI3_9SPHI|nr:hypothetical protein [Pedobacter cryoconitis]MBB5636239.1 hypothetical protein [Pedobacter cryoconitis]MBB6272843.1 hypothetical protein [Pedobacter cryoconitis]